MGEFGTTIRNLRLLKKLSLRSLASRVGVSPAYIHLIELGKEKPPRPEIIVEIAKSLSADLDHLFRLASRLDPEIVNYLNTNPLMLSTIRYAKIAKLSQSEQKEIYNFVENLSLKK